VPCSSLCAGCPRASCGSYRCIRGPTNPLPSAALRLASNSRSASVPVLLCLQPSNSVGARTKSALEVLLANKQLSVVTKACQTLGQCQKFTTLLSTRGLGLVSSLSISGVLQRSSRAFCRCAANASWSRTPFLVSACTICFRTTFALLALFSTSHPLMLCVVRAVLYKLIQSCNRSTPHMVHSASMKLAHSVRAFRCG
jgi:hypothetical protein